MYKYKVEIFDKNNNLIIYENFTPDGYCAELEARKKYPNYKIGKVIRMSEYIENHQIYK